MEKATLKLKPARIGTDINMRLSLTSDGVRVSWNDLQDLRVFLYSDEQKVMAGEAAFFTDPADEFSLVATFKGSQQCYTGDHRVVISARYLNGEATYDAPAFNLVELSAQAQGMTTAEELEPIGIDLKVESITSSIIVEALNAMIKATAESVKQTALAKDATDNANAAAGKATEAGTFAQAQGNYAKQQGDEAKRQGAVAEAAAKDATLAAGEARQAGKNATAAGLKATAQAAAAEAAAGKANAAAERATNQGNEAERQGKEAGKMAAAANEAAGKADTAAAGAKAQAGYAKAQGDYAKKIGDGLDGRVGSLEDRMTTAEKGIQDSQLKDLDVTITFEGGGIYSANYTPAEIADHARKGGNAKILYEKRKYDFIEMTDTGVARFKNVTVEKSGVIQREFGIQYDRQAIPSVVTFTQQFDATELYRALDTQRPVEQEFIAALQAAIADKKQMYVFDDNGSNQVSLVVIFQAQENARMRFTMFNGETIYKIFLDTGTGVVSLDTHRIGEEFSIFNNRASLNIFNLTAEASADDIKQVFTDARKDQRIPESGDVFNVVGNTDDITTSALVISRSEDETGLSLHLLGNDIVDGHLLHHYLKFAYNASVGMDSLRVIKRKEPIGIDPALIGTEKMEALAAKADKGVKTANEVNEYNISHLTGKTYTLQGAISALNDYLGSGARTIGLKMTYVDSASNKAKTYAYQGGSFVAVGSWKDEPLGGYIRNLAIAIGARYNEQNDTWTLNSVEGLTEAEILQIIITPFNGNVSHVYYNVDYRARTNISVSKPAFQQISARGPIKQLYILAGNERIEVFKFCEDNEYITFTDDSAYICYACRMLRKIIGIMDVSKVRDFTNYFDLYLGCPELEDVKLWGVSRNISLSKSPKLSVESVVYMVTNTKRSESGFKITLNASAFARLDPTFIQNALTEKNITIKAA